MTDTKDAGRKGGNAWVKKVGRKNARAQAFKASQAAKRKRDAEKESK